MRCADATKLRKMHKDGGSGGDSSWTNAERTRATYVALTSYFAMGVYVFASDDDD